MIIGLMKKNGLIKIIRAANDSNSDVLGNLVKIEKHFYTNSENINFIKTIGYEEFLSEKNDVFLQGMAGIYNNKAMKKILLVDGIPHIHSNDRNATFILERLFSNVMNKEGIKFEQLHPGYEKFLMHSDHAEINIEYDKINLAFKKGNFSAVAQITENLLAARKNDVNILLGLGRTYFFNGRLKEAVDFYTECLAITPDNKAARESLYHIRDFMKNYTQI